MAFFASGRDRSAQANTGAPSLDLMHRLECKVCPLNNPMFEGRRWINKNPHIEPTGHKKPLIYVLGEAPGADEDANASQFTGLSGQFLRAQIPGEWLIDMRWNNVVRTRPPENRTPEFMEIECCRPSVQRDIEATKPHAIFAFGGVALEWATGQTGLNNWRGRRLPVKIGSHVCWLYSFHHPSFIVRERDEYEKKRKRTLRDSDIGPESDRVFRFDLKRAFAEVEDLPPAVFYTPKDALDGVDWVEECNEAGLAKIEKHLEWAAEQDDVGLDYETNMIRPYAKRARVLTMAVGTEKRSLAWPLDHPQAKWGKLRDRVVAAWRKFLNAPKVRKAVHNLPFELEWTSLHFDEDCLMGSEWDDTMTEAAILDERTGKGEGQKKREQGPLSLDFLIRQYFGLALKTMSKLDRANLANEPLREVLRYNSLDAKFHCMLHLAQIKRIEAEGFMSLYEADLLALAPIVRTQIKGLPVNQFTVERLSAKYEAEIKRLDAKLEKYPQVQEFERLRREKFNAGSNNHVTVLVRDIMKRRDGLKEGGSYSVEEDILKLIDHPVTNDIIARRKTWKVKSTYNDGLRYPGGAYLHDDGKLHPVITTTTARTGRTASEDPNEQNWPAHDESQKEVRSQIEAPDDHLLVAFDYGQIQARNIAMESKDKVFVKALWERYDVHMEWAERLSRAYPDVVGGKQNFTDKKIMKAWRQTVKNKWTFPLFFGSAAESASRDLEIPMDDLKPEYDIFWKTFHGVKDWQERLMKFYREHGYVEALDGRRRRAPMTQNQVFNSPIQADEACIVKDAQTRISRELNSWDYQSSLLVHDDLTYIFPKKGLDERCEQILNRMLDVKHFSFINVPITIEIKIGKNWEVMKEAGDFSSDTWWGK